MLIGHICSNYDKFFTNLMEKQLSKDLIIKVFYFRAKERGMPDVNSSYVDVRLNYSNWHRPFFYLKEKPVIKDFFELYNDTRFDVIHAHTLFSNGYIALQTKRRWGTPYIVAVRDMDINVFFKYRFNLRKLGIEILNEAEKIIFLSESYKEIIINKYTPTRLRENFLKKSVIIPNGIDDFFLENKQRKKSIVQNKTINIITVGFVSKRKNQLRVCEALEHLIKLGYKVNYTIVGKILDEHIFNKINKYDFVNYIPFLPKEKLIDEYRKADIFVMPSLTETFGITYAEAMSQGTPIIYSQGQGFDGQFHNGMVGYKVESKNSKDIANKIIEINKNYDFLSANCTELCARFTWDDIAENYKGIYGGIEYEKGN